MTEEEQKQPPQTQAQTQQTAVEGKHVAMVVVMMCGSFLSALNQNLMNTALATFMGVFSVTAADVQWLITVYTLANGVMIPVTAYLVGRIRTRPLYFCAMGLFGAGTLLAALAPTFSVLICARVVQALGAGISMTLMQTVLFTVFPPQRRGTAMGFFGLIIAFAPAFGPTISGLIIDNLPWHALFVVQLPFIVLLLVLAAFMVHDVTGGEQNKLDITSVVASTLGFGGVLYGFGSAGQLGFAHPVVWGAIVVGAACIVWFAVRQLHLRAPVLNFRVFSYAGFTPSLVLAVGTWSLFIGTACVLPLFMQDMNGFSATQSGMTLMGGGLAMGILSPVWGRVFDRFGARVLVPAGTLLITVAMVAFSQVDVGATQLWLAGVYMTFIIGQSMCSTPLTTTSINALPPTLIAHGSAMNNTMRQVVSAISTAVFVTMMTLVAGPGAQGAAQVPGVRAVFTCLAALAAAMFIAALVVFGIRGGKK